jgi:hypothetical protein
MTDELKWAIGLASVIAGFFMLTNVADKAIAKPRRSAGLIVNPSLGREM